jgi:hypothetical protein
MNPHIETGAADAALRARLKKAVFADATPPFLDARIRNIIRTVERKPSWAQRLMPLAAAVVICVATTIAYQLGHLRLTSASQESYIASVTNRVATLMRVGLADHIHCSVFRKFPKDAPKLEDLAAKLGPQYKTLVPVVRQHLPGDFRLMIAHECGYHGRKFTHLSLKSDSQLVSLVIARKKDGESFETEGLLPALTQSGIPFYRSGVQRFEIASFESANHIVYVVSDMGRQENMKFMLAVAPQVKDVLSKLGS